MKRSSPDAGGLRPARAVRSGGLAEAGSAVRPARLDRQLGRGMLAPGYTDEHLEELVRRAAEEAREAARTEGYAAGWAQGRQAAVERARAEALEVQARAAARDEADRQRVRTLMTALGAAVDDGRRATAPEWVEVADALAEGAVQLAQAVLARELRALDAPVLEVVRTALQALSAAGDAVVHLNPADAALAGPQELPGVRVVADPAVAPGTVVALTAAQRLTLDLPAALAAAERVLRS